MKICLLFVFLSSLPGTGLAQSVDTGSLPKSLKGFWEGAPVLSDFPGTTPLCELELGDFFRDTRGNLALTVNGWVFHRPEGSSCRAFEGPPHTAGSASMRLDLGPGCERLLWWHIPVEAPYENSCYFGLGEWAEE